MRAVNTHCVVHGNKVDTQMTMSGDVDAAYRGRFNVHYTSGMV